MRIVAWVVMVIGGLGLCLSSILIPQISQLKYGPGLIDSNSSSLVQGYYMVLNFSLFIIGMILFVLDKSRKPSVNPQVTKKPIQNDIMGTIIIICIAIVVLFAVGSFVVYQVFKGW